VINKDDSNWWQARRVGSPATEAAGLIPAPELQEWRTTCSARENRQDHAGKCHDRVIAL